MIAKTWSLEFLRIDHDKPLGFHATKICAAMRVELSFGVKYHGALWASIKNNPMPKRTIIFFVPSDG